MVTASPYNFYVQHDNARLLFNAFSGGLMTLDGEDAAELGALLMRPNQAFDIGNLPVELAAHMLEQGFLTTAANTQLVEIRDRFAKARRNTPMVVTLTTTLDCNLGCYYCYQERSSAKLMVADVPALVEDVRVQLLRSKKMALHVDWYGGEPLMNIEFMEAASSALQQACRQLGVRYRASIISNGTLWPDDVAQFIQSHAIGQVQISFDGMKERHDKIRWFRDPRIQQEQSSFESAISLIDRLVDVVRVDVRINMDKKNKGDLVGFLGMAAERGWFEQKYPVVVQPARVADFSERSAFMKDHKLSVAEFDALRCEIRKLAGKSFVVQEAEVPDGYPFPRTTVCAALADDSYVVGADGRRFRCGLQVSEPQRAVGRIARPATIGRKPDRIIPIAAAAAAAADSEVERQQKDWWDGFDPCSQPTCSKCSFLPICWGGCPKKHLENDRSSLDEQGTYWRTNLPRLLLEAAGVTAGTARAITLAEQFRLQ